MFLCKQRYTIGVWRVRTYYGGDRKHCSCANKGTTFVYGEFAHTILSLTRPYRIGVYYVERGSSALEWRTRNR